MCRLRSRAGLPPWASAARRLDLHNLRFCTTLSCLSGTAIYTLQVVDVYEPVEDGSRDKAYISKVCAHAGSAPLRPGSY